MIKRFLCMLCMVLFVFSAFKTFETSAKTEVLNDCSLLINYSKSGVGFEGINVEIHRVAMVLDDDFEKVKPFSSYPISIDNIVSQDDWKQTASTLESYVKADKIKPYKKAKTSKKGVVKFSNLERGLYLVCSVQAERNNAEYVFDSFLINLPYTKYDEFIKDAVVNPKSEKVETTNEKKEYKVTKLWKDSGNKEKRPSSVKIEILKDGVVQKNIKLSKENNWFYSFKAKDDGSKWSVVERNVSLGYRVKVININNSFYVTNTYRENELGGNGELNYQDGPSTGDTFPLEFYMITMCVSGLILVIIGIAFLRGKKNEQGK